MPSKVDVVGIPTALPRGVGLFRLDDVGNLLEVLRLRVKTTRTAVQNIASGTSPLAITMDTEVEDVGVGVAGWFAASSTDHVVPVAGDYSLVARVTFDESSAGASQNGGGLRQLDISVGGTPIGSVAVPPVGTAGIDTVVEVSVLSEALSAGDVVTIEAAQDSTAAMDVTASLSIRQVE